MLWEKANQAKDNSDLVQIDPSKLAITAPTIIYFPGQITTDRNIDLVSMELNEAKKIFNDLPEPPPVYLWSYPVKGAERKISLSAIFSATIHNLSLRRLPAPSPNDLAGIFRVFAYHFSFQHTSTSLAKEQARKIIMPLVTDAEGRQLPFEQAQKNLRNLTFLSYSVGGLATQEVFNAALKMMKKAGIRKTKSRRLLQEIVLVSIGPFAEPKKEDNRYTTVSFTYTDDSMLRMREWILHPLRRIFSQFSRRLKIEKLSDTSILVSGAVRGKKKDRRKEVQKEVIEGVRLPPWRAGAFNHFFHDYVTAADQSCQFSRIAQHALINAVTRKNTIKAVDLLNAPATLEAEKKAAYQRKIQNALCA